MVDLKKHNPVNLDLEFALAQYFLEQLARAEHSALGSRVHGDRGDLKGVHGESLVTSSNQNTSENLGFNIIGWLFF